MDCGENSRYGALRLQKTKTEEPLDVESKTYDTFLPSLVLDMTRKEEKNLDSLGWQKRTTSIGRKKDFLPIESRVGKVLQAGFALGNSSSLQRKEWL